MSKTKHPTLTQAHLKTRMAGKEPSQSVQTRHARLLQNELTEGRAERPVSAILTPSREEKARIHTKRPPGWRHWGPPGAGRVDASGGPPPRSPSRLAPAAKHRAAR